ncbi:MAG: T9SS type A sorting domain-containing protein [candidate division Zixibacteria bacterium]|nr:T9SS type A sorting domain-containing protein [candidate division Zixibacteria bacterium]
MSFDDLLTESWDYKTANVNFEEGFILVALANSSGARIPAGDTTTLFNVNFVARSLCNESWFIHWDTAFSDDPTRATKFADTLSPSSSFLPDYSDQWDSTEIAGFLPGDVNRDGSVDVGDLTALIDFSFISFTPLCCHDAAMVNADCVVDIADLTTVIDHLFITFTPLTCGCTESGAAKLHQDADVVLDVEYDHGLTVLSVRSSVVLRGIELRWRGEGTLNPIGLVPSMDVLAGQQDSITYAGILDVDGDGIIPAGVTQLLRVDGSLEILSATASTLQHESVEINLQATRGSSDLPFSFQLAQNYPNPFNPTTEIAFALPEASAVCLKVFNVLGQEVATLVDNELSAGQHAVEWDASDAASGVYFYRIEAGEFTESKKMLLLR